MGTPSFDWNFYSLFWNDKGMRCKVNIPDTVLFRYGQLSAWWATNKEGSVQRHASQGLTIESIRKRMLRAASDDGENYSKCVAIIRSDDGRPQLLRMQAFNQLCELMSDRLEAGLEDSTPAVKTPAVLQSFIQPLNDIRYVTTYLNQGTSVSCLTFQRKYSRRYTAHPSSSLSPPPNERDVDIVYAGEQDVLQRALENDQGPVEPVTAMQLRKLTTHIVQYIEKAHTLTLGGLVCEYIRDVSGKVYLLSVLRTEWASNSNGHGAGSLGATALLLIPEAEERLIARQTLPASLFRQEGEEVRSPGKQISLDHTPNPTQAFTDSLTPSNDPHHLHHHHHQQQQHQHAQEDVSLPTFPPPSSTSPPPSRPNSRPNSPTSSPTHQGPGSAPASHQSSPPPPPGTVLVRGRSGSPPTAAPAGSIITSSSSLTHGGNPTFTLPRPTSAHTTFSESQRSHLDSSVASSRCSPLGLGVLTSAGGAGSARSSLVQYPGGSRGAQQGLGLLTNSWPSAQHQQDMSPTAYAQPQAAPTQAPPARGQLQQALAVPTQAGAGSLPARNVLGTVQHLDPPLTRGGGGAMHGRSLQQQQQQQQQAGGYGGDGQGASRSPPRARPTTAAVSHHPKPGAVMSKRPQSARDAADSAHPPPAPPQQQQQQQQQGWLGFGRRASPLPPSPRSSPSASAHPRVPASSFHHLATAAVAAAAASHPDPWAAAGSQSQGGSMQQPSFVSSGRGGDSPARLSMGIAPPAPPTGHTRPHTGHVNEGVRGAPLMMMQMSRDLDSMREQLQFQHSLAEASAAKVRQLEHEKAVVNSTFEHRVNQLEAQLSATRSDRESSRSHSTKLEMDMADLRAQARELAQANALLTETMDRERGSMIAALAESQARERAEQGKVGQLESEVVRISGQLREETATVNALKRQLLQYADIAERHKTTLKDGFYEPGMQETLDKVQQLFVTQNNPHGETYAVQKVLAHYYADLRAVFLHYTQLQATFASHWPPSLGFAQLMLFCRDTETTDPRYGAVYRPTLGMKAGVQAVLKVSDCEEVFRRYAALDLEAVNAQAPVLSYESFLAVIVDFSNRLRNRDIPYLSEGLRDYILNYLARANRITPQSLSRGQMRGALEGVKARPLSPQHGTPTPPAGSTKSSAAKHSRKVVSSKLGHNKPDPGPRPLPYSTAHDGDGDERPYVMSSPPATRPQRGMSPENGGCDDGERRRASRDPEEG
ncbi:MAG: hypothetical protein WDW38_002463 [Sanguina aurantia]